MRQHNGQSVAEYSLAAGLIAVVSIGAMLFMANDFTAGWPDLADRIFGGGGGAQAGGANQNSSTNGPPIGGGATGGNAGGASSGGSVVPVEVTCFSSGLCVDIPVVSGGDTVQETAGGMGGDLTESMAQVLTQIAEQIANAEPPPPQGLVDMITNLANLGHEMADAQDELAGMQVCAGDASFCQQGMFGGNTTLPILMEAIDQMNGPNGYSQEFSQLLGQLNAYLDAHPDSLSGFPEAEMIINFEGQQIITIADGFENTVMGHEDGGDIGTRSGQDVTEHGVSNEAVLTDQSSDIICANGGHMNSCFHGPPDHDNDETGDGSDGDQGSGG